MNHNFYSHLYLTLMFWLVCQTYIHVQEMIIRIFNSTLI
jgi:hypothetical protein